jgi:hypothetical protein
MTTEARKKKRGKRKREEKEGKGKKKKRKKKRKRHELIGQNCTFSRIKIKISLPPAELPAGGGVRAGRGTLRAHLQESRDQLRKNPG